MSGLSGILNDFKLISDLYSPDSSSSDSCSSEIFHTPEENYLLQSPSNQSDQNYFFYDSFYAKMIEDMKNQRLIEMNKNGSFGEKIKSSESQFYINIDILKLGLQNTKTNISHKKESDSVWIDSRWVKNCANYSDFSPLHDAVLKKDIKEITNILSHQSRGVINEIIQTRDSNDLTPLHWAVIFGDRASLEAILKFIHKENRLSFLTMEDARNWSVFRWTIEKQDKDLINVIFSHLSDSDRSFLVMKKDNFQRTSIHYAIENGNNELIDLFLNQFLFENDISDLVFSKDKAGQTIFHLAASCLDVDTFEMLLELIPNKSRRSEVLLKKDNLNQTPLHKAARRSDEKTLKLIIRNILDEEKQKYLSEQDSDMKTALHLAISDGGYESVHFLLDEKDVNDLKSYLMTKDSRGKTAFHNLFYGNDSLNKLKCFFEEMKRCSKDKIEASKNIQEVLLDCDNDGRSLLHYSILMGDIELFKQIANEFNKNEEDEKNELFSLEDRYGMNALHYLFDLSEEILNILGTVGYLNLSQEVINSHPQKVLIDIFSNKNLNGVNPFLQSIPIFQDDFNGFLLVLNKIPLDLRQRILSTPLDEMGNTLLHYFAKANQEDRLIEILKLVDSNSRKALLIAENTSGATAIDVIYDYGILDERLKEIVSLIEDKEFAQALEKELVDCIYCITFDDSSFD